MQRIPIAGPWITDKEVAYVTDAAAHGWYSEANVYPERFEKAFAEYVDCRFAVSLPSCTAGIHLTLAALDIGPGDEVIVPDITWIATAAPLSYVGATPVFADVDPKTWCLAADSFAANITPRTRAVIPVDLYGGMPDMDAINEVARRHNVTVLEDAAEAIGSEYHGRRAGSLGDVGVFSFHGSKTLTTGEGGMLVTDREELYRRVLVLRDHGRQPGDDLFYNTEVAFKYKMTSLQAALGLAQLERVEELIQRKRDIFSWYARELQAVPQITLNYEPPETRNTYWMVTAILDPKKGPKKEVLKQRLAAVGIATRPFFHPLSALPAYQHLPAMQRYRDQNRVAYELSPWGINLPSALNLTEAQVQSVCSELKRILSEPEA